MGTGVMADRGGGRPIPSLSYINYWTFLSQGETHRSHLLCLLCRKIRRPAVELRIDSGRNSFVPSAHLWAEKRDYRSPNGRRQIR